MSSSCCADDRPDESSCCVRELCEDCPDFGLKWKAICTLAACVPYITVALVALVVHSFMFGG